jgi:hypothetical protein
MIVAQAFHPEQQGKIETSTYVPRPARELECSRAGCILSRTSGKSFPDVILLVTDCSP